MRKLRGLRPAIAVAAALVGLAGLNTAFADSQGLATTQTIVTNLPATVAAAVPSNNWAGYGFIPIRQGRGLALQWKGSTSVGTSNACLQMVPTIDANGITNATTPQWNWIVAPQTTNVTAGLPAYSGAGTNGFVAITNWARGALDGYTGLVVVGMTNQNAGTLTNGGLIFSYPNN